MNKTYDEMRKVQAHELHMNALKHTRDRMQGIISRTAETSAAHKLAQKKLSELGGASHTATDPITPKFTHIPNVKPKQGGMDWDQVSLARRGELNMLYTEMTTNEIKTAVESGLITGKDL